MKSGRPDLSEKRLRYFFETVSAGSIRGAAELMDVEPSLITRQIQALERDLECKLFERRGRNIVPTDAARYVVAHCRERWASEAMLHSHLSELKGLQRGEIKIVAGEGYIDELSRGLSFDFCQRFPNINITIEQFSTDEAVRMVAEDRAHIAIAYGAADESGVRIIKSRRLPIELVVWPGHPLAKKSGPLILKDILPYPTVLVREGFGVRKLLRAAEVADEIEFRPILTSNSLGTLKNHVMAKLGVTFMSKQTVIREIQAGDLVSIPIHNTILQNGEIHLIVRNDRSVSPVIQKVLMQLSAMRLFSETD